MAGVCNTCGLPKELCICEEIAREQQDIRIYVVKRRYGKKVTIIDGINPHEIDVDELCKKLKTRCASGGTVKAGKIELQGDHQKKVKEAMDELGFVVEVR